MCIDFVKLAEHSPVEDLRSLKTSLQRIYQSRDKTLAISVCINGDVSIAHLKQLLEIKDICIAVESDFKKLDICKSWTSAVLMDQAYQSPSVAQLLANQPALYDRTDTRKHHITFVSTSEHGPSLERAVAQICSQERKRANTFLRLHTLIKCLATPTFLTDTVIIDMQVFDNFDHHTVNNMLICVQTAYSSCHSNQLQLFISVGSTVDLHQLKQILKIPYLNGALASPFDGFSQDDFVNSVCNLPSNGSYTDPLVLKLFDRKKTVATKHRVLSPRQQEILNLVIGQGASNKVIANRLKISEGAVKTHIGKLLRRFGVRSRTELAALNHHF